MALCIRQTLCRHVTIGTPKVIFAVLTVVWLFLTVFDDWYTVGTVLVDMWRLVHQWSFLLLWLSFDCFCLFLPVLDCFWRLVHCWYCLCRHVTIGTPMAIFAVLTLFWLFLTVFDDWYSVTIVKTVKRQSKQQKWPFVYQSSHVYTEFAEYTKSASAVSSASAFTSAEYTTPSLSSGGETSREVAKRPGSESSKVVAKAANWQSSETYCYR